MRVKPQYKEGEQIKLESQGQSSNRKAQQRGRKLPLKHKSLNHILTVSNCGIMSASRLRLLKN